MSFQKEIALFISISVIKTILMCDFTNTIWSDFLFSPTVIDNFKNTL